MCFVCCRRYIHQLFAYTHHELKQFRIKRKKRQAMGAAPAKLRLRKEIRMMSEEELKLFFEAVNSAKKNTVTKL